MAAITKIVGYKLTGEVDQMDVVLTITKVKQHPRWLPLGEVDQMVTSTDVVLTITKVKVTSKMAAITEVLVYKLTGEVDLMVEFQTHFPF